MKLMSSSCLSLSVGEEITKLRFDTITEYDRRTDKVCTGKNWLAAIEDDNRQTQSFPAGKLRTGIIRIHPSIISTQMQHLTVSSRSDRPQKRVTASTASRLH